MNIASDRRPDPFDVQVGARVRTVRKARGISQSDLAGAAGITFQQVQKYERGTNRISASMLQRISRHIGAPMSELLGEAPGTQASDVDWTPAPWRSRAPSARSARRACAESCAR
ncbi:MAG TPA: helix-turn-helix transcriptional regulator [Caulobacteraceae bacterium]|jgi:transcriptional regulator with XRE-family HTH domain